MDKRTPVMDGYAAKRAIRTWERVRGWHPTSAIALTAPALREARGRSAHAGCDAFLPEPVSKE